MTLVLWEQIGILSMTTACFGACTLRTVQALLSPVVHVSSRTRAVGKISDNNTIQIFSSYKVVKSVEFFTISKSDQWVFQRSWTATTKVRVPNYLVKRARYVSLVPIGSVNRVFLNHTKLHYCQLYIPIYLQFSSLFAPTVSKCEIRNQGVHED